MKKSSLALSLLLASFMTVSAFGQPRGEADISGSKAEPSAPMTKAEKAEAKAARKAKASSVAKQRENADASPSSMGAAGATTKAERLAAAKARKAAAADAVKKGETKAGEK